MYLDIKTERSRLKHSKFTVESTCKPKRNFPGQCFQNLQHYRQRDTDVTESIAMLHLLVVNVNNNTINIDFHEFFRLSKRVENTYHLTGPILWTYYKVQAL